MCGNHVLLQSLCFPPRHSAQQFLIPQFLNAFSTLSHKSEGQKPRENLFQYWLCTSEPWGWPTKPTAYQFWHKNFIFMLILLPWEGAALLLWGGAGLWKDLFEFQILFENFISLYFPVPFPFPHPIVVFPNSNTLPELLFDVEFGTAWGRMSSGGQPGEEERDGFCLLHWWMGFVSSPGWIQWERKILNINKGAGPRVWCWTQGDFEGKLCYCLLLYKMKVNILPSSPGFPRRLEGRQGSIIDKAGLWLWVDETEKQ